MSRYGSGKDTTVGYKSLDVRYLHKRGCLVPRMQSSLHWSRNGVQTGWIQYRVTAGAIILSYRHRRSGGEDWTSEDYPVRISIRDATIAGSGLGCIVPPGSAAGV